MKCKLVGKIVGYDLIDGQGSHKLTINLTGADAFGKPISGQIKLYCTAEMIKDLKLQDFLSIDINTRE